MIQYFDNGDLACFDGLSFRLDKRTGYYLNAKTHKRLHVYVWEFYNGEVPAGCHVHHKDMDKRNNEIENLQLLTADEHRAYHARNLSGERIAALRKNMDEVARPKAVEWHKSEAGAIWHKQHYQQMKNKLHVTKTFVCQNCGKEFESTKHEAKFCCNNCKSAARRKSGVDNIEKVCQKCGGVYIANKYQKTKYCPNCKKRT